MATKTFNSFSGIDITAVFNGESIGSIQAFSYSINREKAAIYTMGRANPRAFSRGKRMIAGSLVFILFDANPMIQHFSGARFLGDVDENLQANDNAGSLGLNTAAEQLDGIFEKQAALKPNYVDQIPPFDVVLSAANEYGERASMKVIGVELMNENSGFSIDDIVIEQQYTFIAIDVTPWTPEADEEVKASIGPRL